MSVGVKNVRQTPTKTLCYVLNSSTCLWYIKFYKWWDRKRLSSGWGISCLFLSKVSTVKPFQELFSEPFLFNTLLPTTKQFLYVATVYGWTEKKVAVSWSPAPHVRAHSHTHTRGRVYTRMCVEFCHGGTGLNKTGSTKFSCLKRPFEDVCTVRVLSSTFLPFPKTDYTFITGFCLSFLTPTTSRSPLLSDRDPPDVSWVVSARPHIRRKVRALSSTHLWFSDRKVTPVLRRLSTEGRPPLRQDLLLYKNGV